MRKLSIFILSFYLITFSCQETENVIPQITEASTIKLNSFRQIFKEGFENSSRIIENDSFSQNTIGTRRLSVKNYVKLTKSQYQGFGDFMNILYSSESLDQYIESVIEYLSHIEQSDIEPSDKLFAYTIGAISIESGIYWDNIKNIVNTSNANIRVLCHRNNNSTWSWKEFAGAITTDAVKGGIAGLIVGGTVTLGTLALPAWATGTIIGGLTGGIGYAIQDVFESAESIGSNCCSSSSTGSGRPSSFSNKNSGRGGRGNLHPQYKVPDVVKYKPNCPLEIADQLFIEDLKENWKPNPLLLRRSLNDL